MKRIGGNPIVAAIIVAAFVLNQSSMAQNMKSNWVDQMIRDVERATSGAQGKRTEWKQRAEANSYAAQKYFPVGMPLGQAQEKMLQMKDDGFKVVEYTRDGSRDWPNGVLRPYLDEDTRRNMSNQLPPGVYALTAVKTWRSRLVVEEFFSIDVKISEQDKKVLSVGARRSATFL